MMNIGRHVVYCAVSLQLRHGLRSSPLLQCVLENVSCVLSFSVTFSTYNLLLLYVQ